MFKKKKFVPFLRIILLLLFIVTAVFLFLGLNVEKVQAQYPYSVNCYWDFYKDVYLCASGSGTCYAPCNWCGGVGAYYGHADQLICQNTATGAISYPGSQHCHNGGWDHPPGYSLCYYISSWTCSGSTPVANGYDVVGGSSCSNAPMPPCIVNGACGTAIGQEFPIAPTTNLCQSGVPNNNPPVQNSNYEWEWFCKGSGGGINSPPCKAKVKPSVDLITNKNIVNSDTNEDATLSWSSSNATACNASGAWSGSKLLNGFETVYPSAGNNVYTIQAINTQASSFPDSVSICGKSCSCASGTCIGFTCPNGCGGNCAGTKPPGCTGWTDCSVPCGGGTQTETGCDCGAVPRTRACNTQPCPPGYKEVTPW